MNEQEKAIPKITDAEKGATRLPVSSVIPEGTAYYPGLGKHGAKRPLDDKLIPYAAAFIEIVRLRNDRAAILYNQIVQILREPECELLLATFMAHNLSNPRGTLKLLQTVRARGLDKSVTNEVRSRMEGQVPPPHFWKAMEDFVLQGFNREADIKNGCPKVTLYKSEPLFVALTINTCTDAIGLNVPLHDSIKPGSILHLFGSTPQTRPERRRKAKILAFFRKEGFGPKNKQVLLYGAELSYKAYVNPGKLVDVCNELHFANEPALSRALKPYRDAVGYSH